MRKKSFKLLSVILSIAILMTSLPLSVFAFSDTEDDIDTITSEKEIFELVNLRTATTKQFKLEDGTYYLAQYDTDVHYLDDEGAWQDINNTLAESGNEISTADARIKFAKKTNGSNELFTIHTENRKLSLALNGSNKKVKAQITNNSSVEDDIPELQKMTDLKNISASVRYEDVLDGTDIEYVIKGSNVKENIIVKEKAESYIYEFTLSLNNLVAVMDENGDIIISDSSSGDAVYIIPAAFMYDSAGVRSESVTMSLLPLGNGKYTLTITPSAEWMNAVERVYPITIDPPLYNYTSSSVLDTKVCTNYPNNVYSTNTTLNVGAYWRSYWKMTTLPVLPNAAYIVNAEIRLYSITSEYVNGYVGAYEVNSDWDSTLSWSQVIDDIDPKGMYSIDGFSDYQRLDYYSNLPDETYYSFNITPSVKRWYDGENYGVMFGPVFDVPFNGIADFTSNDYSVKNERPLLCITYKDMKGLEDYWSYSSQSAGFAGSSAVNNATGNLTVTIPTLTTTDALMPFTPTLVYNSALAGRDFNSANAQTGYTSTYMPKGFKLNIGETLIKKAYINENNATKYYFIWSDADGTEHYFMPTSTAGIYEDEDGMMLELQEYSDHVTISDPNNNVRRFKNVVSGSTSQGWYLSSIHDINGNMIIFSFDENARPETVKLCPSGGSSIIQLKIAYNSAKRPYMIWNPTSGEAVIFRYSNTLTGTVGTSYGNYLRQVVRAHGSTIEDDWRNFYYTNSNSNYGSITVDAIASYTYDDSGYIEQINNELSKYQLSYVIRNNKVALVQESAYANGTVEEGQTITLYYSTSSTVVRSSGTDDIINTTDDLLTTYCFDKEGRTVSCYTTNTSKTQIFAASSGEYEDEKEKAKNNLKSSVQTKQQSSNYLLNGGFDEIVSGSVPYWTTSGSVQNNTSDVYKGMGAIRLTLTPSVSTSSVYQNVYLDKGEYYLSMYIRTSDISSGKVYLKAESTISAHSVIQEIPTNESYAADGYVPIGFKLTAAPTTSSGQEKFKISIVVSGAVSTTERVQIDSVMLSKTTGAAEYDMLNFGHFEESNASSLPSSAWIYMNGENIITVNSGIARFGDVLKLDNFVEDPESYIYQTVILADQSDKDSYDNGTAPVTVPRLFTLSGWGKGTMQTFSDKGEFELRAVLNYYNGTSTMVTDSHSIKFDKNIRDWQFASGVFEEDPSKGLLVSITIELRYLNNAGIGYFDSISLLSDSELGAIYEYNDDGLLDWSQVGNNRTWYHYDPNAAHVNPTMVISSQKTVTTYSYNDLGRLTAEYYKKYIGRYDEDTGVIIGTEYPVGHKGYDYNIYGLVVTETASQDAPSNVLELSVAYTTYNTASDSHIFGTVSSETDSLGNVTNYFYDPNNGRLLATTYPEGNGVSYTYDGMGNLIMVTPAQVSASGGYSAVSNSSSVIYRYNSVTNRLDDIFTDSTTYSFTYDSFGNTTEISAGNHELASYGYNANNGKLSVLIYGNGKKVKYLYDVLDRISEIQYNTSGTYQTAYRYTYDTAGNLFSVEDLLLGENTVFKYDESGRLLSSYVYDADTFKNLYGTSISYDGNKRVSEVKNNFDYVLESSVYLAKSYYSYSYSEQTGYVSSFAMYGSGVTGTVRPIYDTLGRTESRTVSFGTGSSAKYYNKLEYDYHNSNPDNPANGYESGLVSSFISSVGTSESNATVTQNWRYEYDANGNITKITDENGEIYYRYQYDNLGQLIREDNRLMEKTYLYSYDNAGNILAKQSYSFTTGTINYTPSQTFFYEDSSWGDLLTKDGEISFEYDEIGNPTRIGYFADLWWYGYDLEWDGRELVSFNEFDMSIYIRTIEFSYNADGIRTSKIVDGVEHKYYLNGSQIVGETWTSDGIEYLLIYVYDEMGSPTAIKYRTSEYASNTFDTFFLEKNLQGDIVAVYDETGFKHGEYVYDAWGDFRIISYNSDITLGEMILSNYNPFRYRGYYYDIETGLYYVSSRYYDPEIGRFISPDTTDVLTATPMGLTDKNLYAYCDNNPVVRVDHGGQFWDTVFDVISLGASIVEVCVNPTDPWAWAGLAGDAIDLIPFVTGVGEVTRAVKTTVKVVDKATDVVDTAKTIYKTADAASDIRKATGSYEILYKSGKNYIGKGGFNRAITSATRNATKYGDEVTSIMWKSAPNSRSAFIDEYLMQKRFGGVLSSNRDLLTYNKIWSPGRRYFGD